MKVSILTVWPEHTCKGSKDPLALADDVECLDAERLTSNPEVDALSQLEAM